jgi:creatinine amidohydrolase
MKPSARAIAELTNLEVEKQLKRSGMVVLACGSVEQHGPHLPAGTDTLIAESLAVRVAARLDALVAPGTALGITPLHMAYASTVTLRAETFMAVLRDVSRSLAAHGVRALAVVNWHEGNIPALAVALEEVQRAEDVRCVAVQACYVAADLLREECGPLTHGGLIETMLMLADHPELVHLDRIDAVPDAPRGERLDTLRRDRCYQPVLTDVREMSPAGWHGDPRSATRERGLAAMDEIAAAIASRLRRMREVWTP